MNGQHDARFDALIARVLRVGVLLSAAIVTVGGIFLLVTHGFEHPSYEVFHGEPDTLRSVRSIVRDALRLDARAVIQAGLLLLIATPIARVVAACVGFLRQRDRLYVTITLTVLTFLAYSFLVGS